MTLITLQFVVPLALIVWLAVLPRRSWLGFSLHVLVTGVWLMAVALCGLWTVLPWWTAHLLGLVLVATALLRLRTHAAFTPIPTGPASWLVLGAGLIVLMTSVTQIVSALAGRIPVPGTTADVAPPFEEGIFLVVNGGSNERVNAHLKVLSTDVPRYRAWLGQAYGVDLIRVDPFGLRASGLQPERADAYRGFGTAVHAPCPGTIQRVEDGLPDNAVPQTDRSRMAGNHVIIRCEPFDLVLAHLRRGSVVVRLGDRVRTGQRIGELGNSGNSDEPHLHVHAQRTTPENEPFSGEPVALRFAGRWLVRNDRLIVTR
ncbi:MAG: peptidoglycan DD-metalloendopeptidase family protein [Burkholderiaceae bacterium]|nr:peptidoglycan DD-metalloendopeptidase family protein [Burkholderiaceae bacterium]MEB2352740.1 M23 family metallopeptidase [Burkholderiaceae bacterium]